MSTVKICPNCKVSLEEGLIYDHFLKEYGGDEERALKTASMYGATEIEGRWGRAIGLYDLELDRTTRWECPDCKHVWGRTNETYNKSRESTEVY
ncbi:MAG: hypothetical protein KAS32_28975 [Candidatus Peribacteraceae bacterium]|nr:hypothetical protein [Candidatus Peribacteraceae bacterium]